MASSKRASAALVVLAFGALMAWGCGSSERDFANGAGSSGMSEAGANDGGSTHAGSADGGARSEAGAGGEVEPEGGRAGQGEGGASEPPDPREPFAAWNAALIAAECQKEVKCARFYSATSCTDARGQYATYTQFFGGADLYGDQLATFTLVDAAARKACLDGIAASACSDPDPASCAAVLVPLVPRAIGASCHSSSPYLSARPCVAGYECDKQGAPCPVCIKDTPIQDVNGACDYDTDCKNGLSCRAVGNVSTCQKRAALAGKCESGGDCLEGTCVNRACAAFVAQNGACSLTALCLPGLMCGTADQKCHADSAPKLGEPCTRHVTTAAQDCRGWCIFPDPEAAIGACGAPPAEGPSPCVRYSGDSQLFCQFGTYADTHGQTNAPDNIPDYCECLPKLSAGTPCTSFQQCTDGRCAPVPGGSVCAARLAGGAPCTGATGECQSSSCNDTTHVCDPVTTCSP